MPGIYTVKGVQFESKLTDAEALEILSGLHSSFALSLYLQHRRNGRLSEKQWPWVHKLATDATAPKPENPSVPDCKEIVSLFETASAAGMKRPKMIFPGVKFSLAGKNSRYPGAIHVSAGTYPGKYFGRIMPDGQFLPGRDYAALDQEFLSRFAADPRGVAIASGHEAGSCRFCGLELTTPESVSVGYGPICAGHWGLPWGK